MFVIFGADPRQNLAAVSNNTASCKLTIYYKHTSTQTHASGSYVFWYYSFLWHQESVNPDRRLANIIKQSHFLKLYWIHLSPFLSLHFRIHAKSLHVMRRRWLCWRSHTILSAWRLRVVWAAGGGICQSTSLMSTPMEWLEKRARSAKVQPHKVCLTYSDTSDKATHACFQGAPLIFPSFECKYTHKQRHTCYCICMTVISSANICIYNTRKWHTPTHTPAILLNLSLSHSRLLASNWACGSFPGLFLSYVTCMKVCEVVIMHRLVYGGCGLNWHM